MILCAGEARTLSEVRYRASVSIHPILYRSKLYIFVGFLVVFSPHRLSYLFKGFADKELEFERSILCRAESIFLKLKLLRF